ncbi:MAG: hypothetical protein ABIZ69_00010, partial [Ilumatobacteraceae bacterium]
MSQSARRATNRSRRPPAKRPAPIDVWRNPGTLPEIERITVTGEPGAVLRSLGDPPMHDGAAATKYFTMVVHRAAAIATALAFSA